MSFDLETDEDKNLLYKMFVARACDGCSSAPLIQYKNNDIYRNLVEYNYFSDKSDERIYIDMRRSKGYTDELEKDNRDNSDIVLNIKLKNACTTKLRYRITGFSKAEYWYLLCHIKIITYQKLIHIKFLFLKRFIFDKNIYY